MTKPKDIANGIVLAVVRLIVWIIIIGGLGFMAALLIAGSQMR